MKILQWMQKRLNRKKSSSISTTHYMTHEPCKQEFSDWPHGLLAIGTFGSNNPKEEDWDKTKPSAEDCSSPSFQDRVQQFTLNLQNELNIYFRALEESNYSAAEQEEDNLPNDDLINKKLNSEHSSLEEHDLGKGKEKENERFSSDGSSTNRVSFYHPSNSVMLIRGKDRCLDHNSKSGGVGKKSLSFLLKKMFVCRSGFEPIPPPFLKDPSLSRESRMDKILREILHKQLYPSKGSSSTMVIKKYLETRPVSQSQSHDDDDDVDDDDECTTDAIHGCKWVKSDAEYIVLEI